MNYTMEFEYIVVITYFKTIKVRYTSYYTELAYAFGCVCYNQIKPCRI